MQLQNIANDHLLLLCIYKNIYEDVLFYICVVYFEIHSFIFNNDNDNNDDEDDDVIISINYKVKS